MYASDAAHTAVLTALRIPRVGIGLGVIFVIGFVVLGVIASRGSRGRQSNR